MPRPPRFPAAEPRSRFGPPDGADGPGSAARAAVIACVLTAGAVAALVVIGNRKAPPPVLLAAGPTLCPSAERAVVGPAVLAYIKERRNPTPLRFLFAVGTDSALPDPGVLALQDKGPTYMYPPNPAQRAVVRAKLEKVGPWPSLLVSYRGTRLDDSRHAVVRLGGRYVGGTSDGVETPASTVSFTCENGEWRLTRAAEERST